MAFRRHGVIRLLWLTVLGASLCACAARVSSLNPIGPLSSATEAPELVGTWVLAPEQPSNCGVALTRAELYLHIYPESVPRSRKIEILANVISQDPPIESAWMTAEGYVTRLKNGPFVNLRLADIGPAENYVDNKHAFDQLKGKYLFAAYKAGRTPAAASLTVGLLSQSFFTKPPAPQARGHGALLVETSARLAAYIGTLSDAALFGESCVFRKAG
jgi:hypothetical protein